MKKKSVFNNNEVDIDLLFNQPKALRKYIGKNKKDEEDDIDDEENEELDEEEEPDTKKKRLAPHMQKYIDDYLDAKHEKEAAQRGRVKQRLNLIKKGAKLYNDAAYGSEDEYKEFKNRFKDGKKGILQKKMDELLK